MNRGYLGVVVVAAAAVLVVVVVVVVAVAEVNRPVDYNFHYAYSSGYG